MPETDDDELDDFWAINLNPELSMAIGCLAVQWSRLESYLHLLCVGLLNARGQNAYILTASLGNRTICDFINACADGTSENQAALAADLRIVANEFNRLLGIRNRIVHGNWHDTQDPERMVTFVARFKGSVKVLDEIWSIKQIEGVIDECLDLHQCVIALMAAHHLDIPLRRWQREASREAPAQQQVAVIPTRDPKTSALVRRLLT